MMAGITFKHHTQIVHNPLSYLHFVVYLRQLREGADGAILSAVERYVMDLIWCHPGELHMRARWLPHESTWLLEGKEVPVYPHTFHVFVACLCIGNRGSPGAAAAILLWAGRKRYLC